MTVVNADPVKPIHNFLFLESAVGVQHLNYIRGRLIWIEMICKNSL